jgi:long-subunit acyl-CoA synthetase (AMP-forming)
MQSLFDAIERHASLRGNNIAIDDGSGSLTHRQLRDAVHNFAERLRGAPEVVGILAPNGREWAVAQLGAALAGKTVVPLPGFFSASQLAHIAADASIDVILATGATREAARSSGLAVTEIEIDTQSAETRKITPGYTQIIYTSGSTGTPKGVRHCGGQIASIVSALASAIQATPDDSYLSVLPLAMLLETVSAIFVPAFVGGFVQFDGALADAVGSGNASGIANAFERYQPTVSVLVPQLLNAWMLQLRGAGKAAPSSLRFVAVGGAPVSARAAETAWTMGIPVHEGYGLSECCSVVSLNRPGERRAGTVGRPLEALQVRIDDGEIVVDGPTVMDGYLGRGQASRPWRTADLGSISEDGYLVIHGRKDNLIVNAYGRNISPEWIEMALCADPRVAMAGIGGHGQPALSAVLIPSGLGAAWFSAASERDVLDLVVRCCAGLPAYAVPQSVIVLPIEEAMKIRLISHDGTLVRGRLGEFLDPRPAESTVAGGADVSYSQERKTA